MSNKIYKILNWKGATDDSIRQSAWIISTPSKEYLMLVSADLKEDDVFSMVRRFCELKDDEPFRLGRVSTGTWELGKIVSDCYFGNSRMWGSDGYISLHGDSWE